MGGKCVIKAKPPRLYFWHIVLQCVIPTYCLLVIQLHHRWPFVIIVNLGVQHKRTKAPATANALGTGLAWSFDMTVPQSKGTYNDKGPSPKL